MTEFEELTLTLADGYRAYGRYWPVRNAPAAVLYLHGIQSHCGWYEQSARRLRDAGFAVLQPDRRGSGRNRQDRGHAESHRQLIADAFCWGQALQERTGLPRFHVVGVSWGGRLACAMSLSDRGSIHSLTLVCPGLFPRIDVSGAEKLRIGFAMLGDRRRLFDIPLNDPELFTSQPRWLEFLRSDDLALHQVSASFFLASRRMDAAIRELPRRPPLPLHLFVAGLDRIIDSQRTIEYVRSLNWPMTRITQFPQARHTLEFEPVCEEYWADLVKSLHGVRCRT